MSDTLRDRIAAAITGIRIQRDGDSYQMADAVIEALGARQEWTYAWNDFESVGHGPPMSHDHAAAASAMVDGAIVTRYVTDWIATESTRQPVEPWHGKAAAYCNRCGIPHVTPCLREENR